MLLCSEDAVSEASTHTHRVAVDGKREKKWMQTHVLLSFPLSAARWKVALGLREPKLVPLCFKISDLIENFWEFLIKK